MSENGAISGKQPVRAKRRAGRRSLLGEGMISLRSSLALAGSVNMGLNLNFKK